MRINRKAEALAREALAGVIGREPDRVTQAFEAIEDDETAGEVTRTTLAVLREALRRVYRGVPSEQQNAELGAEIAASESWAGVKANEVETLLEAVSADQRLTLPEDRVAATLFVTTGYLLSGYVTQLGHDSWYDFLDEILNSLAESSA